MTSPRTNFWTTLNCLGGEAIPIREYPLNLAISSKLMDGVKSKESKTMLATHFTLSLDQVPTPDDLRMKSREYLLIKPRAQNRYSDYGNYIATNTGANSSWQASRRHEQEEVMSVGPSCFHVFCLQT